MILGKSIGTSLWVWGVESSQIRLHVWRQVASLQGGSSADPTSDTAYATQAGIPLPAGYTPPMADSATPALNPNPCLGQDPGFSNGLSTAFYGESIGKGQFDTHTPTFQRCEAPRLLKSFNAEALPSLVVIRALYTGLVYMQYTFQLQLQCELR